MSKLGGFLKGSGGEIAKSAISSGVSGGAMMLPQMLMIKQMKGLGSVSEMQNYKQMMQAMPPQNNTQLHVDNYNSLINRTLQFGQDIMNSHESDVNKYIALNLASGY